MSNPTPLFGTQNSFRVLQQLTASKPVVIGTVGGLHPDGTVTVTYKDGSGSVRLRPSEILSAGAGVRIVDGTVMQFPTRSPTTVSI